MLTRASFMKVASAVALAALLVCALDGLSGAAAGADASAEPEPPAPPEAAAGAPGNTDGLLSRRRFRRWKRLGGGADGGMPQALQRADGGLSRDGGGDGGARLVRVPPRSYPPPVATPPPAPPPPPPSPPSTAQPVTELGFNTCQKIPGGKRIVKVNLKPDIELPELIAWISSITCKSFVLPGHLSGGKKVTLVTQGALTRDEAFSAFLSALDSVGLTVERGPGYYKIIETSKAKTSSVPVFGFDGHPTRAKSKAAGD
jgi:hypothetical protein